MIRFIPSVYGSWKNAIFIEDVYLCAGPSEMLGTIFVWPTWHEESSFLKRLWNICAGRFKTEIDVGCCNSAYRDVLKGLLDLNFGNHGLKVLADEYDNRNVNVQGCLTVGRRLPWTEAIDYLIYGVIQRPLEMWHDLEDGTITTNNYEELKGA